ncbi:MAG: hypothetical protein RXS42_09305, partial [Nitrososphaeria archaeon]
MGFKAIPWIVYYKPSLDEFVIRQRHTHHISERVKTVNEIVAKAKPAVAAHEAGLKRASHTVGRYVVREGKSVYEEYNAVPIKIFKEELKKQMRTALSDR